jgi:hypothetical protein
VIKLGMHWQETTNKTKEAELIAAPESESV